MEVGYTETSALLSSAAADSADGALFNALGLLLDRMPQAPAATAAAKLSTDKKQRRHRSMMIKPGRQFALPPIVKDKKKKKTGCFSAMRSKRRGDRLPTPARTPSLTRRDRNEIPIYQLSSVCRDAPQRRT
jgi:hypothetical protein